MMRKAYILILCGLLMTAATISAQETLRSKQPDLQTTEFFDPTKEKEKAPYQFSTDWRVEAGYVQWEERTLDTTSVYQHGLRAGATVDLNLPYNFSIQTGALATLTYGLNDQHWRSLDAENAPMTASTQWLERTLDDSANRRISLPEGFLCADAILRLTQNVTNGLHVNEKIIEKTVKEYLPFIATENLMMEAVKRGGDRQEIHEIIRRCSMEATAKMKNGEECDLLARLAAEKEFGLTEAEMTELLTPALYIGRCPEQVSAFVEKIKPLLANADGKSEEINL